MSGVAAGRGPFRSMLAALVILGAVATAAAAEDAGAEIRAGEPLAEAIEILRSRGLEILYSSALVRPGMLVERVPTAETPLEALSELLEPHGLDLRLSDGSVLIVPRQERGTIRGTVRAAGGGRLPDPVVVSVDGEVRSAATDRRGRFELVVAPGSHTIEARATRHVPRSIPGVIVAPGSKVEVLIELSPEMSLQESVVVASTSVDTGRRISPDRLERASDLPGDALRAVARTPGAAGSDLSAGMNVRGGRDDELLVILDGLEIYEPFHVRDLGGGVLGLIDLDDVGEVDFFRGGFPARYGNRMSGVLDISSATPGEPSRTVVAAQSGLLRFSSRGRFGGDRGNWLVSARGGRPEYALPEWVPEAEYDPQYYDLLGKLEMRVGPHVTVTASALGGLDRAESGTAFDPLPPVGGATVVDTDYGNRYLWVAVRAAWSAKVAVETVISHGEVDRDRRVAVDGVAADDQRDFEFAGLKQAWSLDTGRNRWQWGATFRTLRADYDYTSSGTPPAEMRTARPSGLEMAAHASDTMRFGESLELELGLRWDAETYTELDDRWFSPRIQLAWLAGERAVARLGWGRYHQAQRIHELQIEDGVIAFSDSEVSEHLMAGFGYAHPAGWEMHWNAYYKEVDDLRPRFENLFDPTGFLPEAQADRVLVAPEHAAMTGVEVEFGGQSGERWVWSAGYALASAEDEIEGTDVPRSWDQRHAVDASVSADVGHGWQFGLSGAYHSGWPTTGATAQTVDGEIVIQPALRNAERFPSYLRFDARGKRDFRFGRHRLSLQLVVLNLTDRRNVCCVAGFEPIGDGPEVRRLEKSSLSRTASAGAVWEF
jgi:hypothetical protein